METECHLMAERVSNAEQFCREVLRGRWKSGGGAEGWWEKGWWSLTTFELRKPAEERAEPLVLWPPSESV